MKLTSLLFLVTAYRGLRKAPDIAADGAIELYRQANESARAYMDLRFRHFGTFVLVSLAIAGGGLRLDELSEFGPEICLLGCTVTVLFWALDMRTAQHLRHWAKLGRSYADAIARFATPPEPRGRVLRAGWVTNLLFGVALICWVAVGVHSLQDAPNNTSKPRTGEPPVQPSGQPHPSSPDDRSHSSRDTGQ